MQALRKMAEPMEMPGIAALLIEDSLADGAAIIKACANGNDYDIRVVHKYTLESGFEHLMSSKVDVILLDLSLPDARGLAAIIRIHDRFPDLPIVIVSGYSKPEMIQQALKGGAQEFLIKGEASGPTIRQSMYQAIVRKTLALAYEKGGYRESSVFRP